VEAQAEVIRLRTHHSCPVIPSVFPRKQDLMSNQVFKCGKKPLIFSQDFFFFLHSPMTGFFHLKTKPGGERGQIIININIDVIRKFGNGR
jgi:hypothetical protein